MIFVKSTLVGLFSLIIVGILSLVGVLAVLSFSVPRKRGEVIGIDAVSIARAYSPLPWIIAVLVFSAGFYWEYKRLKSR